MKPSPKLFHFNLQSNSKWSLPKVLFSIFFLFPFLLMTLIFVFFFSVFMLLFAFKRGSPRKIFRSSWGIYRMMRDQKKQNKKTNQENIRYTDINQDPSHQDHTYHKDPNKDGIVIDVG